MSTTVIPSPAANVRFGIEPAARLARAIAQVMKGKDDVIEFALISLLARGHLLIEDVPGVGKTTLAQALARSFHCTFQRIQFTSDLLPSDVTGITVFNQVAPGIRIQARADLRERSCRRRNQSHHAENAIGAARSHERSASHGG